MSGSQSSSKKLKILLVDDFEMVRVMLKSSLNDLGFTDVEEAGDGATALDMLRSAQKQSAPFDIVFCDWNMPEVTGLDVLDVLRRTPAFAKLPFVMVTAEAEGAMVTRALAAGATDYIVKPVEPAVLSRKIDAIIAKIGMVS